MYVSRSIAYVFVDCFFFFKQKTAYEMRISDWSSDVCSSDLRSRRGGRDRLRLGHRSDHGALCRHGIKCLHERLDQHFAVLAGGVTRSCSARRPCIAAGEADRGLPDLARADDDRLAIGWVQ